MVLGRRFKSCSIFMFLRGLNIDDNLSKVHSPLLPLPLLPLSNMLGSPDISLALSTPWYRVAL